jgi:hypothetical protein
MVRRWTEALDWAELRRLNQAYRNDHDGTKRRECAYLHQHQVTIGGCHNLTARQMRRIVKKARRAAATARR